MLMLLQSVLWFGAGYAVMCGMLQASWFPVAPEHCPHGDDWDACPACRH